MGKCVLRIFRGFIVVLSCNFALGLEVGWCSDAAQEKVNASAGETAEAHVGRGYELVKDERYQEAAKEFQAALALQPGLIRARYQLAICWFALGKAPEAREQFDRLQRETGGEPNGLYYLARLDLRAGDFDAAINRLVKLVANPPFPDTAYYLGAAYLEEHKFEQSEKWLRVAAQSDPRDYRVPDHLARVYQREGRAAEAEQQFETSSKLRESYDEASRQAIVCSQLLETKPLEEAQPACDQLFDPSDSDRLNTLGLLYGQHGHFAEAVRPLEEAAHLDGDSWETQHNLGLTYFRLQRYAEARVALEHAVALRPDFFGSNALLGAALYALGKDDDSFKVLTHAHALNPQDEEAATLLFKEALILADREETHENYDAVLTYLQTAGHLQPANKGVRQRLSELSGRLGLPPVPKGSGKNPLP